MTQYWIPLILQNVRSDIDRLFQRRAQIAALPIMLELLNRANRDPNQPDTLGKFYFGRGELAKSSKCTENSVRTTIKALEKHQIITTQTTTRGTTGRFSSLSTYIYTKLRNAHPNDQQTTSKRPANIPETTSKRPANPPLNRSREEETREEQIEKGPEKLLNSHLQTIVDHWNGRSGPDSYIIPQTRVDDKVRGGAAGATDRGHDFETIIDAITNYAKILNDPGSRWTHAWELHEFLQKGIGKFRDDANPHENFKQYATKTAAGSEYGGLMASDT